MLQDLHVAAALQCKVCAMLAHVWVAFSVNLSTHGVWLVAEVTRADVDVQPYAFTTKSLFVGHMDYRYLRWQVIDTPGILDRPLEERNTIEMQVGCAVLFNLISAEGSPWPSGRGIRMCLQQYCHCLPGGIAKGHRQLQCRSSQLPYVSLVVGQCSFCSECNAFFMA